MRKYFNIITIVLVWIFSVINTSGWGIANDTPTKTNIFIIFWFFIVSCKSVQKLPVSKNRGLFIFTLLSFVLLPVVIAGSWEGFTYLLMVPFVYCFSQLKFTEKDFVLWGYIVCALGWLVLMLYTRTEILSGWNDNQIAMIGLFSYIFYSITLYGKMSGRKLTIGLIVSAMYVITLIQKTESRSALFFVIFSVLFAYRGSFIKEYIVRKKFVFYALNVPLIIAIFFVLFPNFILFEYFNDFSLENFNKNAFNGRDELWLESWHRLLATNFIGEGKFLINHHNSAVAVMEVFGIIGYICWYKLLAAPIRYLSTVLDDNLVFGCLMGFLFIFLQQSFELGFVTPSPNMIPYAILGLGIARVNAIKRYGLN